MDNDFLGHVLWALAGEINLTELDYGFSRFAQNVILVGPNFLYGSGFGVL